MTSISNISEYLTNKHNLKNMEKITGDLEQIPKYNEYNHLLKYNYNLKQLKQIAKEYRLKQSGNKQELAIRVYSHLYSSYSAIKIQKIIRGYLTRKCNRYRGPGFKNRSLCSNKYDFLSMDDLTTIPYQQFFSFEDDDNFIYGFDIVSMYNLIGKNKDKTNLKNPFNTKPIPSQIIKDFRTLLKLNRILKINTAIEIADVTKDLTQQQSTGLRTINLFQEIDSLGHYSNSEWFLSLNRNKICDFVKELIEIWNYRANIDPNVKREICPPHGNPFVTISNINLQNISEIDELRNKVLTVMEKMVTTGINSSSKNLGAFYILGALTLVNNNAAVALPWLHQAMCYSV
jgi:IQ calmodulin-binding motif